MWKLKHTLLAGAIFALAAGVAVAQSVVQDNLSGNETWQAGQGPGGPGGFITSNMTRNSTQKVLNAVSGTFGTGALAALNFGGLVLFTTQPLTTTVLTLPPSPVNDGARAGFCNVTAGAFATTSISFATNIGQSLTAISLNNLAAFTCIQVVFDRGTLTWLRTQ